MGHATDGFHGCWHCGIGHEPSNRDLDLVLPQLHGLCGWLQLEIWRVDAVQCELAHVARLNAVADGRGLTTLFWLRPFHRSAVDTRALI